MVASTEGYGDEERVRFSLLVSRPKAKREQSELTLTQEASLKDREGGERNSAAADFTKGLRR
jgi:hypothetical protein